MALSLRVASPCSEKWESMQGDERTRFCAKCQLSVHNIRELGEADVVKLLAGATGRVCGRIYQRPDGTVLTKDCPVGLAKVRRQVGLALLTVAALIVAMVGVRAGGPSRARNRSVFDADLRARLYDAKEYLRDTAIFGPLINRLDPLPMAGAIMAVPPPGTGTPGHP